LAHPVEKMLARLLPPPCFLGHFFFFFKTGISFQTCRQTHREVPSLVFEQRHKTTQDMAGSENVIPLLVPAADPSFGSLVAPHARRHAIDSTTRLIDNFNNYIILVFCLDFVNHTNVATLSGPLLIAYIFLALILVTVVLVATDTIRTHRNTGPVKYFNAADLFIRICTGLQNALLVIISTIIVKVMGDEGIAMDNVNIFLSIMFLSIILNVLGEIMSVIASQMDGGKKKTR
jgi:hypothetical protein